MAIITISRGSSSKGREVAEGVAAKLGYESLAREVLLEASQQFNVPEARLVRAIHDAPSFFERLTHGKQRYIAFIRAALLSHLRRDNIVYHGLAGHFFVQTVPHVLRVRILADPAERIRIVMARDGVDQKEAATVLAHDDDERRRWGQRLYGIDPADPSLYDLVLHIGKLTVTDAVQTICFAASLERLRTTPASQQILEDLALAAAVQVALVDSKPDAQVAAKEGQVTIRIAERIVQAEATIAEIERLALAVPGVRRVRVEPEFTTTVE
jgi:cytidylate kinase